MNRIFLYILIFVLYSISFSQVRNPKMSRYGFEVISKPNIYYNTFISYNNGPKLFFSLNIQNDILQFKKENEIYKAKFEITVNLKDFDEERTLFSESWYENIQIDDFHETNSKVRYQNSRKIFIVDQEPGKYKLLVELRDAQTGNNFYSKRSIEIANQTTEKIKFSNIVFVDNDNIIDEGIIISSLRDIVELNTSPLAMIEYESPVVDSLKILSELYRINEDEVSELVYENTYSLSPQIGFNYFVENIDNSLLIEGEYILNYKLTQAKNKSSLQDTFKVTWFDKPVYLYKYDLALRPMQYLLSKEEFEKADDLSTNELEDWFKDYWKKKDNTPQTPFNEVQNEFYLRVQKSIQKFSLRFIEGWKSERGETLILYGEPSTVDKHHHIAGSKPYEIWYYKYLNKKITFLDKQNNGDFKLVSIENTEEE
jgi:GWxTD domain-containing protein